jgi:hypothetical protein
MTSARSQPQTHSDRILAKLREQPDGASNAELARELGIRVESVNANCNKLVRRGLLVRERRGRRLINRAILGEEEDVSFASDLEPQPWFWEGSIQGTVVNFLERHGWEILFQANTATHQRGKDIVAERSGSTLWVTVKGFPSGTLRTHHSTQAGHWFADALLDVIRWRQESSSVWIAVALPQYQRYQTLRERTKWLEQAAPFDYLWVTEAGEVLRDSEESADSSWV